MAKYSVGVDYGYQIKDLLNMQKKLCGKKTINLIPNASTWRTYIQMNPGRANKYTRQWKKVWQGGNIWLFEHYFGAQVAHRHVSRCFSTNQLLKCCTPDVFQHNKHQFTETERHWESLLQGRSHWLSQSTGTHSTVSTEVIRFDICHKHYKWCFSLSTLGKISYNKELFSVIAAFGKI